MEFIDLVTLLAVCEERSFSKAAAKLFTSQPTVSARISALEVEVGQDLFVRRPRGVQPTPAGEMLASYATTTLHTRQQAIEALAKLRGRPAPH